MECVASHRVYLGLGSNLGDRLQNLRHGIQRLAAAGALGAISSLYETDPVGVTDQPSFLNAACEISLALSPAEVLDCAKSIERALGRQAGPRWGPRSIDIDILLYDDLQLDSPRLTIPHPRLAERAFVLRPLADLNAGLQVPGLGMSVTELLQGVLASVVRLVAGEGWASAGSSGAANLSGCNTFR
jgi:2-amino-4-hydroxy-6-hydroxymethyldihydropteridine diphosphokinase